MIDTIEQYLSQLKKELSGCDRATVQDALAINPDFAPTFLDLATDRKPPALIDPLDGKSLVGLLNNDDRQWQDDVMMEYMGEGVFAPCLILRKNGFKYVYCEDDPGMLYDLNNDPGELSNLCGNPRFSDIEKDMLEEIRARWNPAQIKQDVIRSQRRRLYIQSTLLKGNRAPWDYQPYRDASKEFVRSAKDTSTTMTKGLARFPYLEPVPPDFPRGSK